MALTAKRVDYYNTTVGSHAADAATLLSALAGLGISLLAYRAVPLASRRTRFTLVPDDGSRLADGVDRAGLNLDGPHAALYVQGDDEAGALADIYAKLSRTGIDACESTGLADIKGGYGVLFYLEHEDRERAIAALER